jgi:hypothetical protein
MECIAARFGFDGDHQPTSGSTSGSTNASGRSSIDASGIVSSLRAPGPDLDADLASDGEESA